MTHLILPFSVRSGLGVGFLPEAADAEDERLGMLEGLTVTLERPLLELAKELMRPWPSSLVMVERGQ